MIQHRFSYTITGDPIPLRVCMVRDAAMALAAQLWKKEQTKIYVQEVDGSTRRPIGYADKSGWHWLKLCSKCKGAGELVARSVATPALTSMRTCRTCDGRKYVEDFLG